MVKAKYLCYQEFVFDDSFWEKRHFIFFDFVCRVEDGVVQLNEEAQDYAWVDIDKIDDYPVDGYLKHSLDLIQEDPHILE